MTPRCAACGRPKLLDAFGCQGGAGRGYQLAGFCVDAVDLDANALRRYPLDCVGATVTVGDAIEHIKAEGHRYAMSHASPPCQAYSQTRFLTTTAHPELVDQTREVLRASGIPFVLENVVGAPLDYPLTLCGAAFGLTASSRQSRAQGRRLFLRRHRLFETSGWLMAPECACAEYRARGYVLAGVYGHGGTTEGQRGYGANAQEAAELLGIDWMTRDGLAQSIPPVFTAWLGEQLATSSVPW